MRKSVEREALKLQEYPNYRYHKPDIEVSVGNIVERWKTVDGNFLRDLTVLQLPCIRVVAFYIFLLPADDLSFR